MWEGRFDVRSLSHEPLIVMGRSNVPQWQQAAKRAVDFVGAIVAIIITFPIMALAAMAIWLEDRGAVTYTARRAGRQGEFFNMFKFRSMVTNADELKREMEAQNERTGPLFKVSNDPRITKVGRFIRETSIDELPQLFNVLRGDMSLVGPRPALPEEEAVFDDELRERFKVRPGITGLWQVEARSNAAFNAYRRLDLHYVENWNIGLDLRILLATAEQVVVTIALLPLRLIRRRSAVGVDGIAGATAADDNLEAVPTLKPTMLSSIFGLEIGIEWQRPPWPRDPIRQRWKWSPPQATGRTKPLTTSHRHRSEVGYKQFSQRFGVLPDLPGCFISGPKLVECRVFAERIHTHPEAGVRDKGQAFLRG